MNRKVGMQSLALTCALLALGGCGSENSKKSGHHRTAPPNPLPAPDPDAFRARHALSGYDVDPDAFRAQHAPLTTQLAIASGKFNTSGLSTDQKINLIGARVDEITTQNINNTLGGKLPSYLYNKGFILGIDYLFWRTDVDSLPYAMEVTATSTSPTGAADVNLRTRVFDNDFGFDSGFRFGLGYTFGNQDRWDLFVNWTYFHNSEETSTSVPSIPTTFGGFNAPYLVSPWSIGPGFTGVSYLGHYLERAESKWSLNYNTIDIELGRNFFIGRQLSFRPHCGVRAAWLNQDDQMDYRGLFNAASGALVRNTSSVTNDQDWHGVGLRTGADLRWGFHQHWAIFGKISASLFYGRFVIDETFLGHQPGIITGSMFAFNRFESRGFNAVRPELEACLGAEWAYFFFHHKYRFSIAAAWEVQEWFQQNMFNQVAYHTSTGANPVDLSDINANLGIQGLTVKAKLNF